MGETVLRWGLGLGALAAGIGLVAQFVGGWFQPPPGPTTIDRQVQYLIIAGIVSLIALGLALGLAYYAGLRTEHDRPPAAEESLIDPHKLAAWSGAIVMAAYWAATTLQILLSARGNGGASAGSLAGQRLVLGLVFVAFGYGLGALGGRAPAARNLLEEITTTRQAAPPAATPSRDESPPISGEPPTSTESAR